jgi:PTS system nitrogen regulatory IIA component
MASTRAGCSRRCSIASAWVRLPELTRIYGLFARLEDGVDFDAMDGEPVDLVFLILAPEDAGAAHLKALARVSRTLRDPAICAKLRASPNDASIYAILTEAAPSRAA